MSQLRVVEKLEKLLKYMLGSFKSIIMVKRNVIFVVMFTVSLTWFFVVVLLIFFFFFVSSVVLILFVVVFRSSPVFQSCFQIQSPTV